MASLNHVHLHGVIHAVSHNNGLPQQETFDGYMSTSPYGMVRVQDAIEDLEDDLGGIAVREVDNTSLLVISGLINLEL